MNGLLDFQRWQGRCVVFVSLLALPLVRYLLQNEYGLLRPEVGVAVGLVCALCVVLALSCRRPKWFYFASALAMVLMSASTTRDLVARSVDLQFRWILLGLAALIAAGMYLLRENFFRLLLIFLVSALGVDIVQAVASSQTPASTRAAPGERPSGLSHVLYVILDEHSGPAGLPENIPACQEARQALEKMLETFGLDYYPRAFSNYSFTRSSIPSILNREMMPDAASIWRQGTAGTKTVSEDRVLTSLAKRNYAPRIYQSDYLHYAPKGVELEPPVNYKANSVGSMRDVPLPWPEKLRFMVNNYLASDSFLRGLLADRTPLGKHYFNRRPGPLAMRSFWPDGVAADILEARRNTVFFAHLLTPHRPYPYRADGTIRDHAEWEVGDETGTYDPAVYERKYRRYSEQLRFLVGQFERLFQSLRQAGVYDSMTIVLHGDHGSRIRLLREGDQAVRDSLMRSLALDDGELYDYASAPPRQDLLDRFSTLAAIKLPGSGQGRRHEEPASVLRIVHQTLFPEEKAQIPEGADSAYLFGRQGRLHEIKSTEMWGSPGS